MNSLFPLDPCPFILIVPFKCFKYTQWEILCPCHMNRRLLMGCVDDTEKDYRTSGGAKDGLPVCLSSAAIVWCDVIVPQLSQCLMVCPVSFLRLTLGVTRGGQVGEADHHPQGQWRPPAHGRKSPVGPPAFPSTSDDWPGCRSGTLPSCRRRRRRRARNRSSRANGTAERLSRAKNRVPRPLGVVVLEDKRLPLPSQRRPCSIFSRKGWSLRSARNWNLTQSSPSS